MTELRPQIITTENVLTSFVAPAGNRVAAIIGTSQWGPIDTVTAVANLSQYISLFGDETSDGVTGIKAADLFFRNGGTILFVRITDGTEVNSAYMATEGATDAINFEGKYAGTYGDNISIVVEAIDTTKRAITITDGSSTETFTNAGLGYSDNDALATAVNATSNLATATVESGQGSGIIDVISTPTFLSGGDDGTTTITQTLYTTAFDDLLIRADYNFLLCPGQTADSFHSALLAKIVNRETQENKYSRYLSGTDVDESIVTMTARTASGKRLALFAPSVKYTNRLTSVQSTIDGSYLAAAVAGLTCVLETEVSATHETVSVEGITVSTSTGQDYYNKSEQNQVLNGSISPISLIGSTIQTVRAVTTITDFTNVYFEQNIVDIVDNVRGDLETYLDTRIGKPNTESERSNVSLQCDSILNTKVQDGIIEEYQPTSAIEGASPDSMIVTVGIKPAFSTNFIYMTLNING